MISNKQNNVERFSGFIYSKHRNHLLKNFFSLSVLQIANYLFPLITLPYVVRVLGVEYFGLLSFATALIGYFQIITDYGFNLTATRQVSIYREDKNKINEVFSSVMIIKVLLLLAGLVFLTIIVFSFEKTSQSWPIFYLTYTNVFGHILLPIWLFQGMEKMKFITWLSILSRALSTIAIFIFIKQASDYYLVPVLITTGQIIAGVISLFIAVKVFNVSFKEQPLNTIVHYFKEGWHVFVSCFATSLYTMSTVIILGLFTNNTIVGYYSAAERIINALKGLVTPVSQTLFPFISRKALEAKETALRHIKVMVLFAGSSMLLLSIILLVFSEFLVLLVLGEDYQQSVIIFRILAIIPFLVTLDTFFGTLTMLVFDRKKSYSRIIVTAGILNLLLAMVLIPFFEHIGAAISVLIVESVITINLLRYIQKNGLKVF